MSNTPRKAALESARARLWPSPGQVLKVSLGFCPKCRRKAEQFRPGKKKTCVTREYDGVYVDKCPCGYMVAWSKTPRSKLPQPMPLPRDAYGMSRTY